MKVSIDYWKRKHMPQFLNLERLVAREQGREPDKEDYFLSLLNEDGVVGCVATSGDGVYGAMIYELFPTRLDIVHFMVQPVCWRCTIGIQMFNNLVAKCQENGRTVISATVPESYDGMIYFLASRGAKVKQIKRKLFSHEHKPAENGLYFEYSVPTRVIQKVPDELIEL